MLKNIIKRYYQNVYLLRAYGYFDFIKQSILFPFDYYFRGGRGSFPLNITLALTLRCNAKCPMCVLSELLNINNEELSFEQYKHFIESCVSYKPGFVLYGGEPFLRKDIIDIIRIIKNHKLSCGVFTNGLILDKNIIRELIHLGMNFVAFSVYGPKEVHDKIVGINGAFDKAIENMSFLKKHRKNTRVIIHCTVSQENIEHLDEVLAISDCDKVRLGHLTFIPEGIREQIIRDLKQNFPNEHIRLISHIFNLDAANSKIFIENLTRLNTKMNIPFTPELTNKEIAEWYKPGSGINRKCFFIWRGTFIAPNGDVYPCMGNFYYKMGNIISEDLTKIWNNDKYINFRLRLKKGLLSACSRCCRL